MGTRWNRRSEDLRFLDIARGSLAEVRTQLLLSRDLGYLPESSMLFDVHDKVERVLQGLVGAIEKKVEEAAKPLPSRA